MQPTPPLLLLDVDGPLNPFAAPPHRRPAGYTTHRVLPESWVARSRRPRRFVRPLRLWLNPDHGPALLGLPFTLVWCTTWMHEANEWIAPRVGLPELPVIVWPRVHHRDPDGIHWKTRHLVEWAAGRPFAWVDDELGDRDRAWVAAHHGEAALLHRVDPRIGLTGDDFAALTAWAGALPDTA
ncbi:hypothetical protein GCM10027168_52080 [Streptomyces capparidis]